ncbi:MAG: hypothetical protein Q9190_002582 [Brigantiaea leucoxantha]
MYCLIAFLALLSYSTFLADAAAVKRAGESGSGKTTRYWSDSPSDCCKPSCAWAKPGITSPVKTCDIKDQPLADSSDAKSGCEGGTSFMCSDQSPWAVDANTAYGFAAVTAANPTCCQCYKLTFTDTAIKGKTMIVQATNTGTDVSSSQFDLAIPGGGFGLFDACTREWNASPGVWGQQYGGMSSNQCPQISSALQPGCGFRWDWMMGADNPSVDFETVDCPAEIVAKSGCSVTGSKASTPTNPSSPSTSTSGSSSANESSTSVISDTSSSDTSSAGTPTDSSSGSSNYADSGNSSTTDAGDSGSSGDEEEDDSCAS